MVVVNDTRSERPAPTDAPVPTGWTFADGHVWLRGRGGLVFAAVWLVFLGDSFSTGLQQAWHGRDRLSGAVGLLATVAFAAAYLAGFAWVRRRRHTGLVASNARDSALILASLVLLAALMCVSVGEAGLASLVYIAVMAVMLLSARAACGVTLVLAGIATVLELTVPGWSNPAPLVFSICAAAFAMWGVQQLMLRNADLLRAREENARLAVAEERNRFARDLHDILGHSLTVITVKAELANRLYDLDPARARSELTDLERLSRDALADVRRAVSGYRDLTLPGELVRAREALLAADIDADLPNSAEQVPTELRELFAWTVREGVTNVIRHSRATSCRVQLDPDRVAISDDGAGPAVLDLAADGHGEGGNGLEGLRERARALGAVLVTRRGEPGFVLEVVARS